MADNDKTTLIAYKAFNKDWQCRGYQFAVGETYTHEGKVEACESGFHSCENPLDVLNYYDLCESKFAVVEVSGEIARHEGDSKLASAKITIKAELSLPEFVKAAIGYVLAACNIGDSVQAASGHSAQLAASGNYAKLAASGDSAKLAASGHSAKLAASGKDSVIASSSYNATAKGADGTWMALAEFDDNGKCIGFATGCIGKDGLVADTFYRARGGKLVQA